MDADRLKTTMTISKAIALMTDKHSVSLVPQCGVVTVEGVVWQRQIDFQGKII